MVGYENNRTNIILIAENICEEFFADIRDFLTINRHSSVLIAIPRHYSPKTSVIIRDYLSKCVSYSQPSRVFAILRGYSLYSLTISINRIELIAKIPFYCSPYLLESRLPHFNIRATESLRSFIIFKCSRLQLFMKI